MDFFKGVSPWIMSKNRTFSYLPFSHKPYKKRSFLILSKKKNDLKQKKIEVLKRIKKMDIFERGQSMDFVEKRNFFLSVFFTEIISENIFFDIVKRKDYFKWKKIEVLNRAKKQTFFKGVSPRFCPKIMISIICVFH